MQNNFGFGFGFGMLCLLVSVSVSAQTEPKFRYFGFGLNLAFGRSLIETKNLRQKEQQKLYKGKLLARKKHLLLTMLVV